MTEIRAFCIHHDTLSETKLYPELTDEEFMDIAYEYSLSEFEDAFNYGDINSATDFLRFIFIEVVND